MSQENAERMTRFMDAWKKIEIRSGEKLVASLLYPKAFNPYERAR